MGIPAVVLPDCVKFGGAISWVWVSACVQVERNLSKANTHDLVLALLLIVAVKTSWLPGSDACVPCNPSSLKVIFVKCSTETEVLLYPPPPLSRFLLLGFLVHWDGSKQMPPTPTAMVPAIAVPSLPWWTITHKPWAQICLTSPTLLFIWLQQLKKKSITNLGFTKEITHDLSSKDK